MYISGSVRALRGGRTTIVIAHRLASIRIADTVVLLHDGRIIAQGTHEQLLSNKHYVDLLM